MEEQEFCIKIDDKEIRFHDEDYSEDNPSSFEVMMDFIPVYYTYKFHENEEHVQIIEVISSRLDYLSHYYRCLKKLESGTKYIVKEHDSFARYISTIIEIGTKIINEFEYRFIHESDVFINEIFRDPDTLFPSYIKEFLFYNANYSIYNKINAFQEKVKNYIKKHRNPQIDDILEILTKLFITDLESSWMKEIHLHNEYSTVFCINNSSINFPNHHIPYSTLLFSIIDPSTLLQRKKQELAQIIALIPYPPQGSYLIQKFDDVLNSIIPRNKTNKKYQSGRGCFAIVENKNKTIYYAISGLQSKEYDFKDLCSQIEKEVFKNIKFQRCFVTPEMVRFEYSNDIFNIPYLPSRIRYISERINSNFDEKDYTCCERKILPYLQPNENDNTFFIRWAPCLQCRPAIYKRHTQIFAFHRDPAKDHPYDSSELKEFHIREVIAYALEDDNNVRL